MKQFEIEVKSEFDSVKPKNYLKKILDVNYNQLIKAIKNKRISLNGKKIKEDSILRRGDIIAVWDASIQLRKNITIDKYNSSKQLGKTMPVEMKDLNIEILFEHKDFLVLNKRAGVVVQGAYDNDESLSKHLRYLEHNFSQFSHLHHVHRLDKDTTGCLLIGNGTQQIRELNALFQQSAISKQYLAICSGHFENKEDTIELKLRRNEEEKLPKVIVDDVGKTTKLKYRVVEEFEKNDEQLSLVEIELITGFMHQIRVTMHHLNHPIVGDVMYSNERVNEVFSSIILRQLLHAYKLEFKWGEEDIVVTAELPEDFKKIMITNNN
ncbi:MAG: RluA family pseudouridine synthase [Candidatus Nanoarchaeia archaeon]